MKANVDVNLPADMQFIPEWYDKLSKKEKQLFRRVAMQTKFKSIMEKKATERQILVNKQARKLANLLKAPARKKRRAK